MDKKYLASGNKLIKQQRYEEAIELFKLAIQYNPFNSRVHNKMGFALRKLKRNEQAIEQYKLAIKYNPSYSTAYYNMGLALRKLKRNEQAIEQYKLAIKYNPSYSIAYNNMGFALHESKRYEEAMEQYKLALKYNPSYSTAYSSMGFTLHELKRYEEAMEQYKLALKYNPFNSYTYYNKGRLLMIMGRYDEAEEEYKQSLKILFPSLSSPLLDEELYELNKVFIGWIMIKRRDFQSANQIFTIDLQNKLSTDAGKVIKAILLYKQRDYHSSLSLLHQINIQDISSSGLLEINYYYYMAMCLWKTMKNDMINENEQKNDMKNGNEKEEGEERRVKIMGRLNKAIERDKEWVKAYYRRAQLLSLLQSPSTYVISFIKADFQFVIETNQQNLPFYRLSSSKITFLVSSLNKDEENGENRDTKLISLIKEDWSLLEKTENDEEKNTPLLRAAVEGDINTVSSLLLHGANLSAINRSGDDIMKLSLPHNNLYLFLQDKKEIYQRDGDGNTLLHKECFAGNVDQVINLLSKGASVHVYNKDGNSPLHLSLLSQFALERIKDAKIQAERVQKIGLIVEKLIESGADLNITNKKFQTALSLIVHLGFENLRVEIGKLAFSNRGEISRGWIRYHLHSALSLYHGDFHHTSKDQLLLDHHVSFLTGYNISELMVEDMWIYIGHLHSLHGEFRTASQDIKKSFENFTISKALSFRIRVLFELLITIEKGILTEQSLPLPIINLLSLLFDELYFTLESLRVYQDQSFIQEVISCSDISPLKDAHVLFLQRKIEGLKSEECYSYPTGFLGHAIYLNIERRLYNNEDSLIFRVDNLGLGLIEEGEGGRTRHHLTKDDKGRTRAYPAAFCVSRDAFLKQDNRDYLLGITTSKWNFKENSLQFLYDELKLLPNRVELNSEILSKIFPSRRIQTVSNCSVKNWQVGLQIRWQSIDQPPSPSSSSSIHLLYRWFRQEEPRYLHTKYKKMAQEGMFEYSNNNNILLSSSSSPLSPSHSPSISLYQSYKKCSEIQEFVESAVTVKQQLSIAINNNNNNNQTNISGGWIIDHKEINIKNKVGEGGSGVIYRGRYHGTTVAVKKLHSDHLSSSDLNELYEEAKVAVNLHFKHIIQIYGVTQSAPYYLVMEYMAKGSLENYLSKEGDKLTWDRKLKLALYVAKGLAFLHLKGIIHRDMKSLNVLVSKNDEVKISDFGLAKVKQSTYQKSNHHSGDGKLGTMPWKAPELFKLGGKHTTASDVYSLGIVLWEISSCKLPFLEAEDEIQIIAHVSTGGRLPLDNEKTPSYYNDIIENCWAQNASDRPTASQVVDYLKDALNLYKSISLSTSFSSLHLLNEDKKD